MNRSGVIESRDVDSHDARKWDAASFGLVEAIYSKTNSKLNNGSCANLPQTSV